MFRQLKCLTLALFLLIPINVGAQSATATPFFMTFVPNVQFSQMYVGIEKGYFADAGFDLELQYGNEPDGVELIALGEREFGLIAGEQVLIARANGRPVVSVYEWWQEYPIVIVTSEGSGIESPADLAGQRIGVPGRFGATYSGLVAFLAANDLTEADINLQEIGFNAPEVVCIGGVVASAVYGNNEPLQIAQRAAAEDCDAVDNVRVFPVADYADLVSNGLITSEALATESPERVAAMVEAFDRSVQDVINNPAEAYLLSAPYIENLPLSDDLLEVLTAAAEEQREFLETDPSREDIDISRDTLRDLLESQFEASELLQMEVLLETVVLWDAEQLGFAETASWNLTQETLLNMGFMDDPIDVTTAFTNEFLP
ncbi:MAG: ABC transporter substrate-binding protein [Chloroflexota bacterium]